MRTLVMGDLHGAYRAFEQCRCRSGFNTANDRLIQLGDVCDGQYEVYECVEALLAIPNLVAIRGNHDAWLQEFIETEFHPMYWTYGGLATLKSYLRHAGKPKMYRASGSGYKSGLEPTDIPLAHRNFFAAQQPFFIDDRNRCFVHAGFKPGIVFCDQREKDFYWDRDLWRTACEESQKTLSGSALDSALRFFTEVFIGHTPTLKQHTDQPMNVLNIWNLDTGAGSLGRLTIMDVDTKEYWQSDLLGELYPEKFTTI